MTSRVEDALTVLKRGQLVIVADAEDREAEGDLVGLAELVTPETVNQMVTHARGLLCAPMDNGCRCYQCCRTVAMLFRRHLRVA